MAAKEDQIKFVSGTPLQKAELLDPTNQLPLSPSSLSISISLKISWSMPDNKNKKTEANMVLGVMFFWRITSQTMLIDLFNYVLASLPNLFLNVLHHVIVFG